MKKYEKPELIEEAIELENIIAESQVTLDDSGDITNARNRSAW